MKPATKAAITRRINAFNKKWQEVVRKKRLSWVTSCSHEFVEFAEQINVLRVPPQTYAELINERTFLFELPNGLLIIKVDYGRIAITLEQENVKTPLQTLLSVEEEAIKEL